MRRESPHGFTHLHRAHVTSPVAEQVQAEARIVEERQVCARVAQTHHPYSMVSLSDAGAHLTFFNDAGFGLHLLGHWARDVGAMEMSEAVRRLTAHPASVFGMKDR